MASAPGAALPWAAPARAACQAAEAEEEPKPLAIEAVGLAIGGRIEVCWNVEPAEGEPYSKWWGARVLRQAAAAAAAAEPDAPAGPSYVIVYDTDEGFDAEERTVQLLSRHELLDLEDGDPLHWRREGEEWEPPEEATLQDLVQSLPDDASLCAAEAEALSEMDAATQRRVAAAFREYTDCFKEYIRDKVEAAAAAGEEFVITAGMVAEFKTRHSARMERGPAGGSDL
ncbi:hypothetical protein Rsub_07913 [Raphidocelis subcapitata]|uniref:Uncharacterized protein n=1 Tax=Raphidocelis subcapitata TaxID=307507 RepID=A0A2V0P5R5_9CHLO|nr:hypothetical protein Rsub_07913 [Raphidocelis subcapitata]|eukprot:GBF95198.1 hypothetical protein Rsub_07913 [Raphidocelis subcapitata]